MIHTYTVPKFQDYSYLDVSERLESIRTYLNSYLLENVIQLTPKLRTVFLLSVDTVFLENNFYYKNKLLSLIEEKGDDEYIICGDNVVVVKFSEDL
jgi:hypothetical protein